ncbi:hypothetical protein ACIP5Z_07330 [Rothia terrae]|uniref:hypothetical protein n=1 Tax=Rothia terrae TaxID=396015 RepID=UPI0038220117
MDMNRRLALAGVGATGSILALSSIPAANAITVSTQGKTARVCDPEFGADPTGVKDSTAAFLAAIKAVAPVNDGKTVGVVSVDAGLYRITPGKIDIPGRVIIRGVPKVTKYIANNVPAGGYSEPTALFSIGSWGTPSGGTGGDKWRMRAGIENAVIKTRDAEDWGIPTSDIPKNLVGILFNTYLGNPPQNPDSYHHLTNIEVWDVDFGIMILGQDDQGIKVNNVRIDRTLSAGLIVGRPLWHPASIAANKPAGGGADNQFIDVDVHGCNLGDGGFAGIEVYTSNCVFTACKSWYIRRATVSDVLNRPTTGTWDEKVAAFRPGAGFFVYGRSNTFIGCASQETGGNGWVIVGKSTALASCRAESASFYDLAGTVTGDKTSTGVSTAACFYLTQDAVNSTYTGCIAQNLYGKETGAKWGFYIEKYSDKIHVTSARSVDMSQSGGDLNNTTTYGRDVYVHVNNHIYTNHQTHTL